MKKRRQYFYHVEVTHLDGTKETFEIALKPHLGLYNQSDLYLEFLNSNKYLKVRYPKFVRMEEY